MINFYAAAAEKKLMEDIEALLRIGEILDFDLSLLFWFNYSLFDLT